MSSAAKSVPAARRVLLKLSGEGIGGGAGSCIYVGELAHIAEHIRRINQAGVDLPIVVGGGNIIRGSTFAANNAGVQEATAHYMGMLGTVINGLALQDVLEHLGCETR